MTVSPEEFLQALTGEADEEVRKRVLQAIEEGEPAVLKMIEARQERAAAWLKLMERPAAEERSEGRKDGQQ